ncbi:MAG: hypothetical protein HN356_16030, partial [Calditrichaeota bacterium]|nr:hypothetical protein [Calditrichota bacterium]
MSKNMMTKGKYSYNIQVSLLAVVIFAFIWFVPRQVAHADSGSINPEENPAETVTNTTVQAEAPVVDEARQTDTTAQAEAPQMDTTLQEGEPPAEPGEEQPLGETPAIVGVSAAQIEPMSGDTTVAVIETEQTSEVQPSGNDAVNSDGEMLTDGGKGQLDENDVEVDSSITEGDVPALEMETATHIEDLAPEQLTGMGEAEAGSGEDAVIISEPVNQVVMDPMSEDGDNIDEPSTDSEGGMVVNLESASDTLLIAEPIIPTIEGSIPSESIILSAVEISEETETETEPALDPYFERQGETLYFRTDCDGYLNCTVSGQPISAALKDVERYGLPDDGIINIEGGFFEENILIGDFSNLKLRGAANGEATTLAGNISIIHSQSISLLDFTFLKPIIIED